VVYFFVRKAPQDFSFGHGLAVLFLAAVITASGEYAREMLRKPYVIARHMYSNGIRQSEVAQMNEKGYLEKSLWVRPVADKTNEPEVILAKGEAMYRGQCLNCHTTTGYRAITKLLSRRDHQSIGNFLQTLREYKDDSPYKKYMPQLVGKPDEIAALNDYLDYVVNKDKSRIAGLMRARESKNVAQAQ